MSLVTLHNIYAQHKSDPSLITHIETWHEFNVDGNPDGFQAAIAKARQNPDYTDVRVLNVSIPYNAELDLFKPVGVTGEIVV